MRVIPLLLLLISVPQLAHCATSPAERCDVARSAPSNFEELEDKARLGDKEAATVLGGAYLFGRGVARDEKRGMLLLESAAVRGSAEAQYLLGKHFDELPDDSGDAVAVTWYRKAAEQHCPAAIFELGAAAVSGKGAPEDLEGGFRLFHEAAQQGYAPAQLAAGSMMAVGNGTKKDPAGGVRLIRLAADSGYTSATIVLAGAYLEGLGVAKDAAEAVRLLEGVYRKQDSNAPLAADALGQIYAQGLGVPRDPLRATRWLAIAAAANTDGSADRLREVATQFPLARVKKACALYEDEGRSKTLGGGMKKGEVVHVVSSAAGALEIYVPVLAKLAYVAGDCVETR